MSPCPIVGMITGGVDFSTWVIKLPNFFGQKNPVPLSIGNFINTVVSFVIIALIVFSFIKLINRLQEEKGSGTGCSCRTVKKKSCSWPRSAIF